MGIRYFVFAVNKMDLVGYSEERFNEIVKDINELSKELGTSASVSDHSGHLRQRVTT